MTNMTWASFQYLTCYFIITCAYSGSLGSYLVKAMLQTRKYNSSYFVFIQHWTWCSKFFHYSVYYFTWHCWCRVQRISRTFSHDKIYTNMASEHWYPCCKTAWSSHLQGSKCHEEMDTPTVKLNTFHKAHKNSMHLATNNGSLAQTAARIT